MLELFEISIVIAVSAVVIVWAFGIGARALVRYGTHLGRTDAVRKREADMAALGISPTDGGVLGDLGPVLAAEDRKQETWRLIESTRWRNRWLPWRRFAAWRAQRSERKAPASALYRAQRDEALEDVNEMRAELTRAYGEMNALRRENAFLRGDVTADPENGKLWPAVNGRARSRT